MIDLSLSMYFSLISFLLTLDTHVEYYFTRLSLFIYICINFILFIFTCCRNRVMDSVVAFVKFLKKQL